MEIEDLKDAVEYTSQKTGFSARLIEKDYYCSLILEYLYSQTDLKNKLIFKGGTLLAKAYTDFFRLSEDLDFSVLNEISITRPKRREFASIVRLIILKMLKDLQLTEVSAFRGFNESQQYNAVFKYQSYLGFSETIKFEVGFRNDLTGPHESVKLKTLLLDAMKNKPVLAPIEGLGLSLEEAYAEKCRAALSRKDPAIRDFFDLWIAKKRGILPDTEQFFRLVKLKIEADSSAFVDTSTLKREALQKQIEHELNSVLKEEMISSFDFSDSWAVVLRIAQTLK